MIEKLKALGESSKALLLYLIGPVIALTAYIIYLRDRANKYEKMAEEGKIKSELADKLARKEELKRDADKKEADYRRARAEYESNLPSKD